MTTKIREIEKKLWNLEADIKNISGEIEELEKRIYNLERKKFPPRICLL